MPRVTPFYAVKCNPEPGLLRLLMALGTGFDCASKGELDMMLKLGVHPSRIIFAHPTKRPCDIRYAKVSSCPGNSSGAVGRPALGRRVPLGG